MSSIRIHPSRSSALSGGLLVAIAAFGFSAKAILVKLAYLHQVDAVTLLAMRMAFSLPFFLAMGLVGQSSAHPERTTLADGGRVVMLGLLGYYLASLLDFWGLEFISAGLERLILFLYPTLVVVFSALFLGRAIKRREMAALILSYLGIALVVRQQIALEQSHTLWGVGLVFGSTLAYAAYLLGSFRIITRLGPTRFTAYGMTVACIACLIQFALTHPLSALRVPDQVYVLALLMAVFSTVLPALFLSFGIHRIGASRASLISSIGPVATIVLAYAVLGEVMYLEQWMGSLLVLAGVLIVTLERK
jgi:drug/metabolite transporter (DMT)-like permease